ncbi:hypothetical protein FRC08_009559 [Ceratobasidium sp. 394]|nr:hypothetical protein FRC08_009559 [Ceratobasidium sp. 394]
MHFSTLFNLLLTLLFCLFPIGLSSPSPAKPVGDAAPALMERAASNATKPAATSSDDGNLTGYCAPCWEYEGRCCPSGGPCCSEYECCPYG